MKVTLWGTRGSLASPGPDTVRYGGNTSCISISGENSHPIIFDAGTGIRLVGQTISKSTKEIHIFLTHLHMDHLVGFPFFSPLFFSNIIINIWGPPSSTYKLESRVHRYLSPPLFPMRVRDIRSTLLFHEMPKDPIEIGEFQIKAEMILHPNPTIGYRIKSNHSVVTYIPDHEPALGLSSYPRGAEWTSGFALAEGSDLLIHDAQYSDDEYRSRFGFGHSSVRQAIQFAKLCNVKELVPFHHDPAHSDDIIDQLIVSAISDQQPKYKVSPGKEGSVFELI